MTEPGTPQKILIVDDEPDIRQLLAEFLTEAGFLTLQASNGLDGLYLLENEKPALVLLDIGMPGLDGVQILGKIKKLLPQTHVIIITGAGDRMTELQTKRLGRTGYLTKPFDPVDLLENHIKPALNL